MNLDADPEKESERISVYQHGREIINKHEDPNKEETKVLVLSILHCLKYAKEHLIIFHR